MKYCNNVLNYNKIKFYELILLYDVIKVAFSLKYIHFYSSIFFRKMCLAVKPKPFLVSHGPYTNILIIKFITYK
jgi:hypothetical protein